MKTLACALLSLELLAATPPMPPTLSIDGKALKLNGSGIRKRFMFKVYFAGLYLETPSRDAAAIMSSDQTKAMRLAMLRGVSGAKIAEAIAEGFERNSKSRIADLKARVDRFTRMIPDVKEGDELLFVYLPGTGTRVTALGTDRGVIEGRDFADALFAVWLGPDPVQEDLKKGLLGG